MKEKAGSALKMMYHQQKVHTDDPVRIFLDGLLEDDDTINKMLMVSKQLSKKNGNINFHQNFKLSSPLKPALFSPQSTTYAVAPAALPPDCSSPEVFPRMQKATKAPPGQASGKNVPKKKAKASMLTASAQKILGSRNKTGTGKKKPEKSVTVSAPEPSEPSKPI